MRKQRHFCPPWGAGGSEASGVISFSGGSSRPGDQTSVSCIGKRIIYHRTTGEAHAAAGWGFSQSKAGSAQDERSRGQSGQHLVGRLFLHCGLWAYCSKADCPEHPAPGKPGGDASSSWTAPSSLSSRLCCPPWALPAGHPEDSCTEVSCSPSGPGTGRAARRPSGREPAHFGDSRCLSVLKGRSLWDSCPRQSRRSADVSCEM